MKDRFGKIGTCKFKYRSCNRTGDKDEERILVFSIKERKDQREKTIDRKDWNRKHSPVNEFSEIYGSYDRLIKPANKTANDKIR